MIFVMERENMNHEEKTIKYYTRAQTRENSRKAGSK